MATKVNPFLEGLASMIGPALASVLEEPLNKIYEKNPKKFGTKVKAGLLLFGELAELTAKSPTKIDDSIVNAIVETLKKSALDHKIKL